MKKLFFPLSFITIAILMSLNLASCSAEPEPLAPGESINLAILNTTDLHGRVLGWNYYLDEPEPEFSMAKAATIVDSLRQIYPNNLLLDAGDWLQGNPFAEFYARVDQRGSHYALLRAADIMNYDAMVLGNHEFNYGIDYLNSQLKMTNTPVIGANIYKHGTKNPAYPPYIITNKGGVKVAVIGLTTPGSAVWDRPRVEGKLDFKDGVKVAKRFVDEVYKKGAEVVIILAHTAFDGSSSYSREDLGRENFGQAIADEVDGIHAMILGHRHREVTELYQGVNENYDIPVIEAGRWGSHVGFVDLKITRNQDGSLKVVANEPELFETVHAAEHPEIVHMIEEDHQKVRAYINAPIAYSEDIWSTSESRIKDTPAIDLIQKVQMEATGAQLSAAAAFTTELEFGDGEISLGQIALLYPYENSLYKMRMSGKQIREFLEHTSGHYQTVTDGELRTQPGFPSYNFDMIAGLDYTLDLRNDVGNRVTRLEYEGRNVRDDDSFTIAINSYRAEGAGGFTMMADAEIIEIIDRTVRDIIIDYLTEKESITHDDVFRENWKLVY